LIGNRAQARIRRTVRALSGALAVLASLPGLACVNSFDPRIMAAREPAQVAQAAADAERAWRNSPTLENTNDLAVAWILGGRIAEAIPLLRQLEESQPGSAVVAANLGTALDLTGADQEALLWIREGLRRDPGAQQGSEWVHVKILEAELALKRDRNWLRTHSVVGWREGRQLLADERGLVRSPVDLLAPIKHQLRERTRFIAAPDAIVGDLYLTLGDIAHSYPGAFANRWEQDAEEFANYARALDFGTVHEVRARERMDDAKVRIEASRPEREAAANRARLADAQAKQEAKQTAERRRQEERRRAERREEQLRRRQLALWVFVSLAVVVAVALLWRRRRRPA
jgi:hypothetical protein